MLDTPDKVLPALLSPYCHPSVLEKPLAGRYVGHVFQASYPPVTQQAVREKGNYMYVRN